MLNAETLARIAGRAINDNMRSVVAGLEVGAEQAGLARAHHLAHYIAQLAHESSAFVYDREIWGPTAAQERYDTRTDLGNTPARDGDGYLYRGRTSIQVTGKANYTYFTEWVWKNIDPDAPDFVRTPDQIVTDPWEGLAPIWFWDTHDDLSGYAEANNIEMVTRTINGGLNGYADRLIWYDRTALVVLGYERSDIRGFQRASSITVDGISGPQTRGAMHELLAGVEPGMSKTDDDGGAKATAEELIDRIHRLTTKHRKNRRS